MALKIISDIHGEYTALSSELGPEDTGVLLGDYLNLVDFRTLDGILSQVYSREQVIKALLELKKGGKGPARKPIQDIVGADPEKYRQVLELMRESYTEFFASLPCFCYLIYGNTDSPQMMRELAGGNVEIIEAGVVELEGLRFGLVSGSPGGPWSVGLPGEVTTEEYQQKVESIGPVDVLCSHFPPAIPDLTWDLLANRDEAGSEALLTYLDENRPTHHYFGHVHNPRESSMCYGPTRLVNAGFFKQHKSAIVHPAGEPCE